MLCLAQPKLPGLGWLGKVVALDRSIYLGER